MSFVVDLRDVRLQLGRTTPHPVDFRVEEFHLGDGEQLAVTGPSGCGKSTLLNLVAGLQKADQGTIQVLGQTLHQLSTTQVDRLRGQSMGMVHQEFLLLDRFSALENVLIGLRFGRLRGGDMRIRAQLWLERVGLAQRRHAYPPQLSMGERQRVALARAMAHQPRLILADEPTGALDPATAADVFGLVRSVCTQERCALLLVTHDLALASQLPRHFDAATLIARPGAPS